MNNIIAKTRTLQLGYLIGAMAIALLLYTGLKWYQMPEKIVPQPRAQLIQEANNYFQRGNQFYKQGVYPQALEQYKNAVAIHPQHHQAHTMASMLLMRMNNPEQALEHAKQAVASNGNYLPARLTLGEAYIQLGKLADARIAYADAITLDPENFEAHLLLSQLLIKEMTLESSTQAVQHAQHALKIKPNSMDAQCALGDAYLAAGRPGDARIAYQAASDPNQEYRKLIHLGQTYEREKNSVQAIACYKQSIALKNDFPQSHVALAGAYFADGKLGQAFKEYEWRWHLSNMRNLADKWQGQDVSGKKLLVLSENGIGDIFQYVRFAQLVKERGAYVMLVAAKSLLPLFKQCPYIDELHELGSAVKGFDYVTSMQSIPAVLNVNETNLPNKPYLFADQKLVDHWKQKLAADTNFKIGLCWQPGDDTYMALDQKRGLPSLELLKPLAQKGVSFYCLQMGGNTTEQIEQCSFQVKPFDIDFDKSQGAFMDSAAVMKNMDLIITVDTSVAHLAGGLGVKTFLLLPYASDVRWMIDRSDSIWYPHFTLFRQEKMGDWKSVIEKLSNKLNHSIPRSSAHYQTS